MDGESEAHTQRAEACGHRSAAGGLVVEANVKREGVGSHEPARVQQTERPARRYREPEAGAITQTMTG